MSDSPYLLPLLPVGVALSHHLSLGEDRAEALLLPSSWPQQTRFSLDLQPQLNSPSMRFAASLSRERRTSCFRGQPDSFARAKRKLCIQTEQCRSSSSPPSTGLTGSSLPLGRTKEVRSGRDDASK